MFSTFLVKKKGTYHALGLLNMLAFMIAPFANTHLSIVDDGGGTAGQQDLLEKVSKEAAKAVESFKTEFKELVTKANQGSMTKEQVDKHLEDFSLKTKELTDLQLKTLSDQMTAITSELAVTKANLKASQEQRLDQKSEKFGFGTLLRKSLEADNHVEEITVDPISGKKAITVKGWDRQGTKITVKAAVDMTTALSVAPGATPGTSIGYLTDYKMKDVMINLTKDTHATQFLPTDPIVNKYMGVLVEHTYFDGAGVKAEGSASGKSSIKFKTIEFKAIEYATHFRVSKENLSDLPRLESRLNRIAPDKILSTLDAAVFSTTGDNSATAWGLYYAGNYVPFDAAGLGTVEGANLVNLIGKMVLQANNADEDVNVVVLHPSRLDSIRQQKDLMNNSAQDRNVVFDAFGNVVSIWGLTVVKNKAQGLDRVTVMWNEAAEIGMLEDITFEIGTDGTDLTEGMRTIIFWMRAAFGVSKPGAVFMTADADGAISDITTVTA